MRTKRWNVGILPAVVLWAVGLATAHAGNTYYVAVSGSDVSGNGSQSTPWASVTYAVAQAAASDTIRVGGGVYTQNVSVAKANLTIQGGYNPSSWALDPANQPTTIFGNGNSPITISATVTNTFRFLTLRGGTLAAKGGVALTANYAGAIIDGCSVTGNLYGVYIAYKVKGANLRVRNTLVARNTSHGIYAYTYDQAGGMSWFDNCTIADNGGNGYYGYSVSAAGQQFPWMANSLVTGNNGFGIYLYCNSLNEWGYWSNPSSGAAGHSLFYGNARGPWYSKVVDNGGNKFCQDPQYVDAPHGDYRLLSSSPAAASGKDLSASGITQDIVAAARPGPNGWDMGAYQGSGTGAAPSVAVGYVSKLGSDANDGSSGSPWGSVSYGIGRLSPNGTLYVAGGVYTDNVWLGEGTMAIRGGYDPSDWSWDPANQITVIDGNVNNPPITALSQRSTNSVSYLTLRGGTLTTSDRGAGLRLNAAAPGCLLVVDGCTIKGNYYGVHNRALGAALTIRNTVIARNSSHGIYDNIPRLGGGTCRLLNCTIANNGGDGCYSETLSGGFDNGPMVVYATNSLFTGNNGYGVNRAYGFKLYVAHSLFSGNPSGPWSGRAFDFGHNKIGVDPAYVDAANDDYRLTAASLASAAGTDISAFGVTTDILAAARPGVNGWDMGAYQGGGTGMPSVAVGYISASGSDSTGDGSSTKPWASVTYGVARLGSVGTLKVAGGAYTENVWLGSGTVTIQGGLKPSDWSWDPANQRTVISGNGRSPVTLFSDANTSTLNGLTLTGAGPAAGIYVGAASPCSLVADSCTITGNTYGVHSADLVTRVTLRNCLIAKNSSNGFHEPSVYHDPGTSPGYCRLVNCTVADNGGDGCYITANSQYRSVVPLFATNTLFTGNARYGIYLQAGGISGSQASHSLFHGNAAGAWYATNSYLKTSIAFGDAGGNITGQAPLYVGTGAWRYALTKDSPAFDSGLNLAASGVTYDILGVSRPQYAGFDRGAYELVPPKVTVVLIR